MALPYKDRIASRECRVSRLEDALAAVGADAVLRERMVKLCHEVEARLARLDFDVREQVTGPIVDALHRDVGPLQKRLRSGLVFHFRYGGKIARDFVMSADEAPDHVWEPQTTKLLLHLAERARTVVVAGAYAGDQALLVAQRLQSAGGTCHCFEPDQRQLEILQENARANRLERHMVVNGVGLWDSENAALRLVGEGELGRPEEGEGGTIPTTTVDAYGARHGLDSIDVLMLDVEGGEHAILRGAARYLSQPAGTAPTVVFEIHRAYVDWSEGLDNTDIGRLLRAHGYRLYAIRDYQSNVPMAGQPVELVDTAGAYLEGPPHGFNMLAVKDASVVQGPLFRVCSGVSPKLLRHRDPRLHHPLTKAS
jgi:FkbM family methyltransferase